MRTTPGSRQALDELKASIAAHGVLENLLVRPVESGGRTCYEVVAGRRRLNVLGELAEEGALHPDAPVPCAVADPEADDTELSLAENTVRLEMHPADPGSPPSGGCTRAACRRTPSPPASVCRPAPSSSACGWPGSPPNCSTPRARTA